MRPSKSEVGFAALVIVAVVVAVAIVRGLMNSIPENNARNYEDGVRAGLIARPDLIPPRPQDREHWWRGFDEGARRRAEKQN